MRDRPHRPRHPPQLRRNRNSIPTSNPTRIGVDPALRAQPAVASIACTVAPTGTAALTGHTARGNTAARRNRSIPDSTAVHGSGVGRAACLIGRPGTVQTAVRAGPAVAHGPEPSAERTVSQSRPYQHPLWLTVGRSGSALLSLPPPDRGTTTYTVSPGST
jgi:hypothetical protein